MNSLHGYGADDTISRYIQGALNSFDAAKRTSINSKIEGKIISTARQFIAVDSIPIFFPVERCHKLFCEATHGLFIDVVPDILLPYSLSNAKIRPATGV